MSSADQQAGRGPPAAQGLSGRTAPAGDGRGSCGGCPCNGFGLTGEMRATARRPIPVAIDCCNDPREVKKVLLKVARESPDVLSTPAPAAVFEDFGESFNFKLFVYYDTNKDIQTDLRVAILEAFHSSGFAKWLICRTTRSSIAHASVVATTTEAPYASRAAKRMAPIAEERRAAEQITGRAARTAGWRQRREGRALPKG